MSRLYIARVLTILVIVACFAAYNGSEAMSESGNISGAESRFSKIGGPGPRAIEINVTTSKVDGNVTGKDDPVSVGLSLSESGYVMAVFIAPAGDVIVVFPDTKTKDNFLTAGKSLEIVGPDSGLKLGFTPSADKGRIVIYVSSRPFALNGLTDLAEGDFMRISSGDTKNLSKLLELLDAAARDDMFNRKIITPEDLSRAGEEFGFMGLPRGIQSSEPESVAGVQGARQKKEKTEKE